MHSAETLSEEVSIGAIQNPICLNIMSREFANFTHTGSFLTNTWKRVNSFSKDGAEEMQKH
jgi:hypothetical protein